MCVLSKNKDSGKKRAKETRSEELSCDACKSKDISENREGMYVCQDCGIVLEEQKLKYYKPYNEQAVQNAILTKTYLGYKNERYHRYKFDRLNKLHSISDSKKATFNKARYEISRILYALKLPNSYRDLLFEKFKKIYGALRPSTKYRAPEKLVPLVIYFFLKFNNVSINEKELLEVSRISKKEFNAFKLQIDNFYPEYHAERSRQEYALQRILEIAEHFDLGMLFFYQSKALLYRLWKLINNTKEDVIVGVVASITSLCWYREKVTVNAICKKLGIQMSTIQWQLKNRIAKPLKISGFVSLVRSSESIKKRFLELGLIQDLSKEENSA